MIAQTLTLDSVAETSKAAAIGCYREQCGKWTVRAIGWARRRDGINEKDG
jgi:hypothetical protein